MPVKILLFFCGVLFLTQCSSDASVTLESNVEAIDYQSIDFSKDFYSDATLAALKAQHPIFFPPEVADSLTLALRSDSLNRAAYSLSQKVFPDLQSQDEAIKVVFGRLHTLFPSQKKFRLYYSVGFFDDFTQPVLYNPNSGDAFVSLDLFLGSDFAQAYDGFRIPEYLQEQLIPERMVPALAEELAEQVIPINPRAARFVDQMIYEGKKMLTTDLLLGDTPNHLKIGFSKEKYDWCLENEEQIWQYFVENDLLFSTENRLRYHFLQPAPYSKFATASEQNSPGRVGVWVGWRIMQKWLNKTGNDPEKIRALLYDQDYDKLFQESKYKP